MRCRDTEQHAVGLSTSRAGAEIRDDRLDVALNRGIQCCCLPESPGHRVGDDVRAWLEVLDCPRLHDIAVGQFGWTAEGVNR